MELAVSVASAAAAAVLAVVVATAAAATATAAATVRLVSRRRKRRSAIQRNSTRLKRVWILGKRVGERGLCPCTTWIKPFRSQCLKRYSSVLPIRPSSA
uniref:Putative secreted peptide n=1 Tax=Anopheles braziliensis TaxID=58242 RepID=A0A2M3ZPS5_9DIPT